MKLSGNMDGLLSSGALRPNELGYLARTDLDVFKGGVSFDQAITAYVGKRSLTDLSTREIGDIGEAVLANDLAKKGYRDLVPIQNNSGHGNDLVGTNPLTGRQEVFEAKASVHGLARQQTGDPDQLITARLNRAYDREGHWSPGNMWEEQAASTARRILLNNMDQSTGRLDVDAKWARVNITKDADGIIRGTPSIEPWRAPTNDAPAPSRGSEAIPESTQPGMQRKAGSRASLLEQLTPDDARLASKIQEAVPNVSEEHLALATLLAKKDGITDESKLRTAAISGDTLWIVGNTPGFRERVSLSEQAPAVSDTVSQMQAFNTQQREIVMAQNLEQQTAQQGPAMVRT